MGILEALYNNVVVFLVVLTVLVFVHELGHFWIARRNGVRVEVFSIGFGPELFGWTDRTGTRWKFSAVPLGGYVKMFGEPDITGEDTEPRALTDEEKKVSFHHKRLGQRSAIVLGGPLANFVFAALVLAGLFAVVGKPVPLAAVGSIQPGSAAAEAGFMVGDRIVAIDDRSVRTFEELRQIVSANPGAAMTFLIERTGRQIRLAVTPKPEGADTGRPVGRLGVAPDPEQVDYERANPALALWMGVERTADISWQILGYVGQVISRSRPADELGGPLRIAHMSGQAAQGGIENLLLFMAVLSINLGIINLFPVPMLDGGHLVFYAAEAIRGRPLGPKAQEYGFRIGLILVFLLMIFATWNDLVFFWRRFTAL